MPKSVTSKTERFTQYESTFLDSAGPAGTVVYVNSTRNRLLASLSTLGTFDSDWRVKVVKRQDASGSYARNFYRDVKPRIDTGTFDCKYWNTTWKRWDVFRDTFRDCGLANAQIAGETVTDSTLRDIALKRFKAKLSGRLGGAELLVPAIELRELRGTIRQSVDLTSKTLRSISTLVRKHRGTALIGALQEAWLTYSFGISPMISDTKKALEAVNNYFEMPLRLHRIHSSAERTWVNGRTDSVDLIHSISQRIHSLCYNSLRYSFTGGFDFRLLPANNYSLQSHLGLDDFWSNLPSVGWELMPFSWVIDYFTTVGDFLGDTLELPPGISRYLVESRYYTGRFVESSGFVIAAAFHGSHSILGQTHHNGSFTFISTSRTVLSNLPHRSIRFKTTDEIGRSATQKLLNLCSLVRIPAAARTRTHT